MNQKNKELKSHKDEKLRNEISIVKEQVAKQVKADTLNDLYGITTLNTEYNRSDEFEKRQFADGIKKKTEELEIRELRQDVSEKILYQDQKILEFRDEAKEDRYKIRQEMWEGFSKIVDKIGLLEKDLITFQSYVTEKFSTLELAFFKELESLKGMIIGVHSELKLELSETKLQMGKEILRMDRQQLGIIDKIRSYEHKINSFSVEMRKVKVDAERFAMRGETMLEKAQVVHQRHKTDIQKLSNEISVGLEKMALKEEGFANRVGAAKIKLDEISNQQYLTLKDIAHEKLGVEFLRKDHENRVALEKEKMGRLNDQRANLLMRIQSENTHSKSLAQLNHKLHMTEENLSHSQNRYSILSQELSTFRRLSK